MIRWSRSGYESCCQSHMNRVSGGRSERNVAMGKQGTIRTGRSGGVVASLSIIVLKLVASSGRTQTVPRTPATGAV